MTRYAERFANSEAAQRRKNYDRQKDEQSSEEEEEDELISKLHEKTGGHVNEFAPAATNEKVKKMVLDTTRESDERKSGKKFSLSNLADLRKARNTKDNSKKEAQNKNERKHDIIGLEADSKRKNGDAQRKGKSLEPFAYVRLNPSLSKEKHKAAAVRSFKKISSITKKGAKAKRGRGRK